MEDARKIVAFDTETVYFEGIDNHAVPEGVSVSFTNGTRTRTYLLRDAGLVLQKLFSCPQTVMVGQNTKFDLDVILRQFPGLRPAITLAASHGRIKDTMLREKLVNVASGLNRKISLAGLVETYFGEILDKSADTYRLRYAELKETPVSEWPEAAIRYAEDDVIWTRKVYFAQTEEWGDMFEYETLAVQADWALKQLSVRGCAVDPEQIAAVEAEAVTKINEALPTLVRQKLVDVVIKPEDAKLNTKMWVGFRRNDEAARKAITEAYDKRGIKPPKTDKGLVAIDDFSCSQVNTKTLKDFAQYNAYSNVIAKDIVFLKDALAGSGRVHTTFDIIKKTGRVSSRNPNLQNLRRGGGIRECFVPDPGKVFVFADYSSAELHTLAQVCLAYFGESKLAEKLLDGSDLHVFFGAVLSGKNYSQLYDGYKKGVKRAIEIRQVAKAANYGLGGFMGPATFAQICLKDGIDLTKQGQSALRKMTDGELSDAIYQAKRRLDWMHGKGLGKDIGRGDVPEDPHAQLLFYYGYTMAEYGAHVIREKWLETFPEMKLYKARAQECVKLRKLTLPGIPMVRHVDSLSAAANTPFQGLAAQGALTSLIEVEKRHHSNTDVLRHFEALFFVHDEIGGQVDAEHAEDVAKELKDVMERGFNKFTPEVPVKVEAKVCQRWSK